MEDTALFPVWPAEIELGHVIVSVVADAPDQLQSGSVAVASLFDVHLVVGIAEIDEALPDRAITHADELQVGSVSEPVPDARDIEFHSAARAGRQVIVDAVRSAVGGPARAAEVPAPDSPD